MIKGIKQMTVKAINCHHPDFPMSWSLLAPTANEGKRVVMDTKALIYKTPSGSLWKIHTSIRYVKNPAIKQNK